MDPGDILQGLKPGRIDRTTWGAGNRCKRRFQPPRAAILELGGNRIPKPFRPGICWPRATRIGHSLSGGGRGGWWARGLWRDLHRDETTGPRGRHTNPAKGEIALGA